MPEFYVLLLEWLDEEYRRLVEYDPPSGYQRGVWNGRLQVYAEVAAFIRARSLPRHTPSTIRALNTEPEDDDG